MNLLQELIHWFETGRGVRIVTSILIGLVVIVRIGIYDLRRYQNMSAPEAMDAAQLARNLSRGRGFTTEFIRPLSIYLVKQKNAGASGKDPAQLNTDTGHPDISNAPGYPFVLAGLMKILPFRYDASLKGDFWSLPDASSVTGRSGTRYEPDFLIAVFNQLLFVAVILLAFFWAKWLFDGWVAWTSFFLLLATPVLLQFSVSGLSTMMLMLIFMGLFWCLTLYEREAREPKWGRAGLLSLGAAAGLLTGAGALTRYSFMWMMVPVLLFLGIFGGPKRVLHCFAALAAFGLVFAPWLARNYAVSGTPFGTAGYALVESFSPQFHLQRSLQPDIPSYGLGAFWSKAASNLLPILQNDLFTIGGWATALFLAGLLLGFRNPALRRLRYFIVASLAMLALAQALGRTQLSDETPEINSENLLVLLAPVLIVYGVGIFYYLLDNIKFPIRELRYAGIGIFIFVLSLPAVLGVLSGRKNPVVYPPYRPDFIQNSSTRILKPTELMMSDIPWAVAWYGDRQCVWMTLYANPAEDDSQQWQESFYAVNHGVKPVNALYLSPRALDSRLRTDWLRAGESSWADFIIGIGLRQSVPSGFPLTKMPPGYWPEQLLLCDRARW